MRVLLLISLFATSPLAGQTPAAPDKAPQFSNWDFSKATSVDQIWDGVGGTGHLRTFNSEQGIVTLSGAVSRVPMAASPALADVTGDGVLDLVVGDPQGYIWIYKNSGTKTVPAWTYGEILPIWLFNYKRWTSEGDQRRATAGDRPWMNSEDRYNPKISVTDWNGDNSPDVLVGTFYGEIYVVPLSSSGGQIRVPVKQVDRLEVILNKEGRYWGNLFAPLHFDWNKDLLKDLILGEGTYSANSIWIMLNEGSANSPEYNSDNRKVLVYGDGKEQLVPAIVDWDNDGNPDVLVADYKGAIHVYPNVKGSTDVNQALPAPEPPILVKVGTSTSFGSLANLSVGDINGDGLFDLVIGRTNGALQLCLNTGKLGAPEFKAAADIKGVDLFPKYKIPATWSVAIAGGKPYHLLEQVNDPTNTPSLPDRTGGDCLKFSFVKPQNVLVSSDFPDDINPDSVHRLSCSDRIPLREGRSYTITFYAKSSGWSSARFEMTTRDPGADSTAIKNRRGETVGQTRDDTSRINTVGENISSGGWKQYSFTHKVKSSRADALLDFRFYIDLRGQGELFIDDVKIVEK